MRKIKEFLNGYFYFTGTEKRGITALLILIFLIHLTLYFYPDYAKEEPSRIFVQDLGSGEPDFGRPNSKYDSSGGFRVEQKDKPIYYKHRLRDSFPYTRRSYEKMAGTAIAVVLDLNSADSATLVALPGIGPVLAGKIINFRSTLGGFISEEQLLEIRGFNEGVLFELKNRLTINKQAVKMLDLNRVTESELKQHPYFRYKLSRAIINYRLQHGAFKSVEEIRNIRLVNDSVYSLVKNYLQVY